MSSINATNWWQIALAGTVAFAACTFVGWWYDADNLKKKKGPQRGGGGGGGGHGGISPGMMGSREPNPMESMDLERLLSGAEMFLKDKNFREAQPLYEEALEIVEGLSEEHRSVLIPFISRRLASIADATRNDSSFEKYMLRAVSFFEQRQDELNQQERQEYSDTLERLVDYYFSKVKNTEKAERPLQLWLDLGEKANHLPTVAVASHLLGKIKKDQHKYEEAERYYKQTLSTYPEYSPKDDVYFTAQLHLAQVCFMQDKHALSKAALLDAADAVSKNSAPSKTVHLLGTVGEMALDLGYMQEAAHIIDTTLQAAKIHKLSNEDVCQLHNHMCTIQAEMGKHDEARTGLKNLKESLKEFSVPLTFSYRLRTETAVVAIAPPAITDSVLSDAPFQPDVKFVVTVELRPGLKMDKKLPAGTVLMCKWENPEEGKPHIETEHVIQGDSSSITLSAPIPFARKSAVYLAEILIFKDAEKQDAIGCHYQLIKSLVDTDNMRPEDLLSKVAVNI